MTNLRFQRSLTIVLGLWVFSFIASCSRIIYHDPQIATVTASEFARRALLKREYSVASDFLLDDSPVEVRTEKVKEIVEKMHSSKEFPTSIIAVAYEPVPGTPAIRVFLDGSGTNQSPFFYCFVMQLQNDSTYRVSEIYRSPNNVPFPSSSLRRAL